jgi:cytochrome P450
MFNCYHLNLDEKYYKEPRRFEPMRFLTASGDRNNNTGSRNKSNTSGGEASQHESTVTVCPFGKGAIGSKGYKWGACVTGVQPAVRFQIHKPEHYFPFSWGKRSCLGYKMVQTIMFSLVANLVLQYELGPHDEQCRTQIEHQLTPKGCLALPVGECFELQMRPRRTQSL